MAGGRLRAGGRLVDKKGKRDNLTKRNRRAEDRATALALI